MPTEFTSEQNTDQSINNQLDNNKNQNSSPSLLESAKQFAKPVAKLGAGAGAATAAALLIAGPIGIILAVLISAFAAYSAGKDVEEIFKNKSANNLSNCLYGNQNPSGKDIIENLLQNPAIAKNIENDTINNFRNHKELECSFQKIVDYHQKNPISSWLSFREIYNENSKEKLGLLDLGKLQNPTELFNNLKPEAQEKFANIVATIVKNPQIIDEFAKKPDVISKTIKECLKCNDQDITGIFEKKLELKDLNKVLQEQKITKEKIPTISKEEILERLNNTESEEENSIINSLNNNKTGLRGRD